MDPKVLAGRICDEADDFLGETTRPAEARAGIEEWLTIYQPTLAAGERKAVTEEAMTILAREGFFERAGGGADERTGDRAGNDGD